MSMTHQGFGYCPNQARISIQGCKRLIALLDLPAYWPLVVALLSLVCASIAAVHILLYKRDHRAAVAWMGLVWLLPLLGSLLYLILGVNRIKRRASTRREGVHRRQGGPEVSHASAHDLERFVPPGLRPLSRLSNRVSRQPLLGGNALRALVDGDEAYPEMLGAIRRAEKSMSLSTYIFYNDTVGREFAEALGQAVARGVEVRVLIDAVGLRYSLPTIEGPLSEQGVRMRKFMPNRLPWTTPFMNLRNHRKILIVDGQWGFFGGMNIGEGNCVRRNPARPMHDLHFSVEGPVVAELQEVFAEDWEFAAGETLEGPLWFPEPRTPGATLARVVADGPDERFDTLRQIITGALSVARHRVRVMTPYFLPDSTLEDALCTAALRGVDVHILLPGKNNLPVVDWAARPHLEPLLRWGCRIWFSEGNFDHSKLMTVDGEWALPGSANWDPRSLSLNFEANVECYDPWLVASLDDWFESRRQASTELTLEALLSEPLQRRLRNGVARLFSPYL